MMFLVLVALLASRVGAMNATRGPECNACAVNNTCSDVQFCGAGFLTWDQFNVTQNMCCSINDTCAAYSGPSDYATFNILDGYQCVSTSAESADEPPWWSTFRGEMFMALVVLGTMVLFIAAGLCGCYWGQRCRKHAPRSDASRDYFRL